jgi:REP element-mobilizing transposase RayT
MFWQRRMPYAVPEGSVVFVTWRPAGTMAKSKVVREPDPGKAFLLEDRELDKDQTGPQWLKDVKIAAIVADALLYGSQSKYELYAWVVMSNHVHIVIRPNSPLPGIMKWLKAATASRANQILNRTGQPFWAREYYDHCVRDTRELDSVIHYIEWNPVKAGIVASPEEYPWSSAKGTGDKIAGVT